LLYKKSVVFVSVNVTQTFQQKCRSLTSVKWLKGYCFNFI